MYAIKTKQKKTILFHAGVRQCLKAIINHETVSHF